MGPGEDVENDALALGGGLGGALGGSLGGGWVGAWVSWGTTRPCQK